MNEWKSKQISRQVTSQVRWIYWLKIWVIIGEATKLTSKGPGNIPSAVISKVLAHYMLVGYKIYLLNHLTSTKKIKEIK